MVVASLFLLTGLWACTPTCDKVCTKLHDCELLGLEDTPKTECVMECQFQESTYDDLEETKTDTGDESAFDLKQSFDDLKDCIMEETCNDLADGACHSSDIYTW